jgi:hypothetical protein
MHVRQDGAEFLRGSRRIALLHPSFRCYAIVHHSSRARARTRDVPPAPNDSEDAMAAQFSTIRGLVGTSLVTAACLVTPVTTALAEPSDTAGAVTTSGAAGQWIHIDPQTGARTARPPADAAAAMAGNPAFSTSSQGLVEEPAPGGGVTVNLQGRFRSAVVATVGADGKVSVDCQSPGYPSGKE